MTVAVTLFQSHRQIKNTGYKNLIRGVGDRLLYLYTLRKDSVLGNGVTVQMKFMKRNWT